MSLTASRTVPIFRVFDVAKAREFYVGYLGFAVDWEHRFDDNAPLYMQVSRGGLGRTCRSTTATAAPAPRPSCA